jgi:hypothetical protein
MHQLRIAPRVSGVGDAEKGGRQIAPHFCKRGRGSHFFGAQPPNTRLPPHRGGVFERTTRG